MPTGLRDTDLETEGVNPFQEDILVYSLVFYSILERYVHIQYIHTSRRLDSYLGVSKGSTLVYRLSSMTLLTMLSIEGKRYAPKLKKQAVWISCNEMILRNGREKFIEYNLSPHREHLVTVFHKVKSINWLLCYRFFMHLFSIRYSISPNKPVFSFRIICMWMNRLWIVLNELLRYLIKQARELGAFTGSQMQKNVHPTNILSNIGLKMINCTTIKSIF